MTKAQEVALLRKTALGLDIFIIWRKQQWFAGPTLTLLWPIGHNVAAALGGLRRMALRIQEEV